MVNFERCTLCQPVNCNDIMTKELNLPLGPYLLAWQKGSDSRPLCGLCALVHSCLNRCKTWDQSWDVLLFRYNYHNETIVVIATTMEWATGTRPRLLCGPFPGLWSTPDAEFCCAFLSLHNGIGEFKTPLTSRRLLSSNPGSNECLDIAKGWLTECSKHAEPLAAFVPSRLVDVRPSFDDEDDAVLVSLREQDDWNDSYPVKYVALSYCWGVDKFLTTTSLNMAAMRQSISIPQLPQTVQDAIKIIRYLGIRYLWVDSLCIVQGVDAAAQQDWLSESKMIGQIYRSAHFTISAESASTALAGILNERPKPPVDICAIPISAGSSKMIYLAEHWFGKRIIPEPLHSRGWTLQETLLSRRLLKFGTKEMSWQCPHKEERESRGEAPEALLCNKNNTDTTAELNKQARNIYTNWQKMVEDYSKRAITVKSDKLHAIAGLVRIVQPVTEDIYVAGVWNRHAPLNLLWMHTRNKPEYARKEEFQAPTWSWASVEGSIHFLREYHRMDDLIIEWKPRNNHSAADFHKTHDLTITGRMVQLSTIHCDIFGFYPHDDEYFPWKHFPTSFMTNLDDLNDIPLHHRKCVKGNTTELVNSWFLLLAERDNCVGVPLVAGLIVLPSGSDHNYFRRVGMVEGFRLDQFHDLERDARSMSESFKWNWKPPARTIRLV